MTKKLLLITTIAFTTLTIPLSSQGSAVLYLSETFASGATYNGTITFTDNKYTQALSTIGTLMGGMYGIETLDRIGERAFFDHHLQLIGSSRWFVTLDFGSIPLLINTTGPSSASFPNAVSYSDGMVSGSISAVPVPAAISLFGSGLLGLTSLARKRKATQ